MVHLSVAVLIVALAELGALGVGPALPEDDASAVALATKAVERAASLEFEGVLLVRVQDASGNHGAAPAASRYVSCSFGPRGMIRVDRFNDSSEPAPETLPETTNVVTPAGCWRVIWHYPELQFAPSSDALAPYSCPPPTDGIVVSEGMVYRDLVVHQWARQMLDWRIFSAELTSDRLHAELEAGSAGEKSTHRATWREQDAEWLLERLSSRYPAPGAAVLRHFDDYRLVDGAWVAHHVTVRTESDSEPRTYRLVRLVKPVRLESFKPPLPEEPRWRDVWLVTKLASDRKGHWAAQNIRVGRPADGRAWLIQDWLKDAEAVETFHAQLTDANEPSLLKALRAFARATIVPVAVQKGD